eukprot:363348-Chlamydomonas_euryale.AAC.10
MATRRLRGSRAKRSHNHLLDLRQRTLVAFQQIRPHGGGVRAALMERGAVWTAESLCSSSRTAVWVAAAALVIARLFCSPIAGAPTLLEAGGDAYAPRGPSVDLNPTKGRFYAVRRH